MTNPDPTKPDAPDLDTFIGWYRQVHMWSGSAFLAGEKMPKDDEKRCKSDLYFDLCSLGNFLMWHAENDQAALVPQLQAQLAEAAEKLRYVRRVWNIEHGPNSFEINCKPAHDFLARIGGAAP